MGAAKRKQLALSDVSDKIKEIALSIQEALSSKFSDAVKLISITNSKQ